MEASVLKYLKFEMTAPTTKCFLRRFLRAAQVCHEAPVLHLEFLANYIAELSLLEYSLICYVPSLIAASSIFLAKFILKPTENPWNSTLSFYTQYKPSDLCNCAKGLHRLFLVGPGGNLRAVREKYSQHKVSEVKIRPLLLERIYFYLVINCFYHLSICSQYKFVAKKYSPPSIPAEFFEDPSSYKPD
jgi:cyclin A